MRNKVALIVCYFGKFPVYYQLWLNSCAKNPDFTWLVFTDDDTNYNYPGNVLRILTEFDDFTKKVRHECDFEVNVSSPYKLCDFKPLYGVILKEYLKEYTHWGHCDVDIIWGDLSKFINDEKLDFYSKLFRFGHLSIYKNDEKVNNYFRLPYSGLKYSDILSDSKHFGFDEGRGMTQIYRDNHLAWLNEIICADINVMHYNMLITGGGVNYSNQYFMYQNGHILRYVEGQIKDEFAYIHLQKRKMKLENDDINNATAYYINPDMFSSGYKAADTVQKYHFEKNAIKRNFILKVKWNFQWKGKIILNSFSTNCGMFNNS